MRVRVTSWKRKYESALMHERAVIRTSVEDTEDVWYALPENETHSTCDKGGQNLVPFRTFLNGTEKIVPRVGAARNIQSAMEPVDEHNGKIKMEMSLGLSARRAETERRHRLAGCWQCVGRK